MDVRGRRAAAGLAAAAVLLVGGCSAARSDASGAAAPAVAAPAGGAEKAVGNAPAAGGGAAAGTAAADKGTAGGPTAAPQNRVIAYKAQLTVRVAVDRLDAARSAALGLVDQAGGFVAGENATTGPGAPGGSTTLTLKVPSAAHQRTLEALAKLGEQISLTSQAEDLTQQVADVDSRLKSMQASVDRVRALMADAKSLAEVVSLESELTRRESDLEALQRQQQDLAGRGSLSTITLQLVVERGAAAPAPVKAEKGFWASIGGALAGGWHVLVALVRGLLMGLAAMTPLLVVAAPVAWLARWTVRRRRAARPKPQAAPPMPTADPWQGPSQ